MTRRQVEVCVHASEGGERIARAIYHQPSSRLISESAPCSPFDAPPSTSIQDSLVAAVPKQQLSFALPILCRSRELLVNQGERFLAPDICELPVPDLSDEMEHDVGDCDAYDVELDAEVDGLDTRAGCDGDGRVGPLLQLCLDTDWFGRRR